MGFLKKIGKFLFLFPLFIALIITISGLADPNSNNWWVLTVIFLILISFVTGLPGAILVLIDQKREKKKEEKKADEEDIGFESFVS